MRSIWIIDEGLKRCDEGQRGIIALLSLSPPDEGLMKEVDEKTGCFADLSPSIKALIGKYCKSLGAEAA